MSHFSFPFPFLATSFSIAHMLFASSFYKMSFETLLFCCLRIAHQICAKKPLKNVLLAWADEYFFFLFFNSNKKTNRIFIQCGGRIAKICKFYLLVADFYFERLILQRAETFQLLPRMQSSKQSCRPKKEIMNH
jgi:hypothetical protein